MLTVKTGVQNWSSAPQKVDLPSDGKKIISATNSQFEDQEIGDVLNKIADPNYVDPEKKVRNVGNKDLDKDSFMKLLLTQMKNQDPTNPMQSHEMAAQLAQFTSLEKLTNISDGIDGLTKAQAPTHNFEALNYIGKAVSGDSSKIDRVDEKDSHEITFRLAGDANQANISIKGPDGQVIRTLAVANLKQGKNAITWNGNVEDGNAAPRGAYTVSIEAHGSNGSKIFADTKFDGVITGVNFTSQGPLLMIGKNSISLKEVKEIVDPRLIRQEVTQQLQVKKDGNKATPNKNSAPAPMAGMASNLENVPMSQGLINQLNKQVEKAGG